MTNSHFDAFVVRETAEGRFEGAVESKGSDELPEGSLRIQVDYSSLNYKDALSASGNRGVTRHYPHTPGIDAAGVVLESADPRWKAGDPALVTGYDLGMNTSGGFGQQIRIPAEWALPLPGGLNAEDAMALGTAGFTAAICLDRLIGHSLKPDHGPILVTGGSGGVGTVAILLLKKLGYRVEAMNGRTDRTPYLSSLGVDEILDPASVIDSSSKPLLRGRWVGAVDTVGGDILASVLKQIQKRGIVACCGNAASHVLQTTVLPFILNGITLTGTDSANAPQDERERLWNRLATDWSLPGLSRHVREIGLGQLDSELKQMLGSTPPGRVRLRLKD